MSGGQSSINPALNPFSWLPEETAAPAHLWPPPRAPYLEQGGEHVERVHGAGAVRIAQQLVDMTAPRLLRVVTGRRLKRSEDGREEGRGGRRDSPLPFSKAGTKANGSVRKWRPPLLCQPVLVLTLRHPFCPLLPLGSLWEPGSHSEVSPRFFSDSRKENFHL